MDLVGVTLVSTFVLLMVASVFALHFQAPPRPEKFHEPIDSTVIG